jgi:hypothetical protein
MSDEKRTTTTVWLPLECDSCGGGFYEPVTKKTLDTLEAAGVPPQDVAGAIEKRLHTGELSCHSCRRGRLN